MSILLRKRYGEMNFFAKARERGLNAANIISWLGIRTSFLAGGIAGTLALRLKARLLGVRLGRNVTACGNVALMRWPGGKISIGNDVQFVSSWRRSTACSLAFPVRLRVFGPGSEIEIGDGCQMSGASITARSCAIRLGRGVLLGPNCIMVDSDFHAHWPPQKRADSPGYENDAPVSIGDYAWIGLNVIILKGVTIGKGAIIGAGSVVTRDIPENFLACGNPCRPVRKLGDVQGDV